VGQRTFRGGFDLQIRCPQCRKTTEAGTEVLKHGSFEWKCPSCGRTWRVATALTEVEQSHVGPEVLARVRDAIKESGFTQAEIGHFLGFSPPYISTLLSGKRRLTPDMARRLLEAAGIHGGDASDLLRGT
jgi:antitoxin component HigA of HigAB toxin-antitoxin module